MDDVTRTMRAVNAQKEERIYGKSESDEIQKSDIMESLRYGSKISFHKTGLEIKNQVENVVMPYLNVELSSLKEKADNLLKNCGLAPTASTPRYVTDGYKIDIGYKIYNWDEKYYKEKKNSVYDNFEPEKAVCSEDTVEEMKNLPISKKQSEYRKEYNALVYKIGGILIDIKACEILKTLDEKTKYELTPNQILSLKF